MQEHWEERSWYEPAGQAEQEVELFDDAKFPGEHSVQTLAPALENLPHAQLEHGVPPEVATPNVPASHGMQDVEPVEDA